MNVHEDEGKGQKEEREEKRRVNLQSKKAKLKEAHWKN